LDHTKDDPSWLQTPCTVGLGEPNRRLRCLASSVARRSYRESSIPRVRHQARAIFRQTRLVSRRARAERLTTGLGQYGHSTQDAFRRLDAQPCG
jgi:hypothetical protein